MAKAKIRIVSVNKSFSQDEIDCMRRIMNTLIGRNLSVAIEFNESGPIPVNQYINPGEQFVETNLKVKRNVRTRKSKTA